MALKMPSIALARRIDEKNRDALIKRHGSTDPLKLEERRVAATNNIKLIKGFIERLRAEHKGMVAQEQAIGQAFQKAWPDPKAVPPEVIQQYNEGAAARSWQRMQLEILTMQFNAAADQIDASCLVFDALTVRMIKKNKAGKEGRYRQTAAFTLFDICGNLQSLMTALRPDAFPEARENDEPQWEPEIDDEDIFFDDEPETKNGK